MKADAQTEAAVMAALEHFQQATEQRDVESLLAAFAQMLTSSLLARELMRSGLGELNFRGSSNVTSRSQNNTRLTLTGTWSRPQAQSLG